MKKLDLIMGNPAFLASYWKDKKVFTDINLSQSYMYGSLSTLKKAIKLLHKQQKNANIKNKYIVVGCGASQILQAIFACYGKNIWAKSPYFGRFPVLAQQAGIQFNKINTKDLTNLVQLVTSPNNPDNSIQYGPKNSIFDLSYNWTTYTKPKKYNENIMIFSMAKITGHASTRIGWCILSDHKLAKKVTEYIEVNSGGTSIESQSKATHIIKSQLNTKNTCFKYGKDILLKRWKQLKQIKTKFTILNNSGMFLYIKMKNIEKYFNKINVLYLKGSTCGMTNDYGRINIGCSDEDFKEFLKRIKL